MPRPRKVLAEGEVAEPRFSRKAAIVALTSEMSDHWQILFAASRYPNDASVQEAAIESRYAIRTLRRFADNLSLDGTKLYEDAKRSALLTDRDIERAVAEVEGRLTTA